MLRRASLHLAAVLLALATLALLFGGPTGFSRSMDFNQGALEDFMGPYLQTGRGLLETGQPARGFLYPPGFALALVPFAWVDAGVASWIWLGIVLAATGALLAAGLALARPDRPGLGALGLYLGLTSLPLAHNLHWGQVSAILGALVLAAALAERAGRRELATLSVACATAIKLYPVLFLAVPLARREWGRVGRGLLLSALLVAVLPALVLGPETTLGFLRAVAAEFMARRDEYFHAPNAQALGPVLARWTGVDSPLLLGLVGLGVAATQLPLLARVATDPPRAYALVAVCLPLVIEPHWPHYFVWLPFVQLLLLARARGDRITQGLALASAVLSNLILFRALGPPQAHGAAGLLAVANLLALAGLRRLG